MFNKATKGEEFYEQIRRTNANFDKLHDKLDKLAKALGYEWKSKAVKKRIWDWDECDEIKDEAILVWDWEKKEDKEEINRQIWEKAAQEMAEIWTLDKPKRKYTKRKVAKKK